MGVDPELLPKTLKEGMQTAYYIGASQGKADNDSRQLADALMEVPYKEKQGVARLLGKAEMHFRSGLSRLFMGNQSADDLQLPNTPLKYTLILTTPMVFSAELVRLITPGGNQVASKIGRYFVHGYVENILGGKLPDYVPYHEKT